jgi:hypothetical protein
LPAHACVEDRWRRDGRLMMARSSLLFSENSLSVVLRMLAGFQKLCEDLRRVLERLDRRSRLHHLGAIALESVSERLPMLDRVQRHLQARLRIVPSPTCWLRMHPLLLLCRAVLQPSFIGKTTAFKPQNDNIGLPDVDRFQRSFDTAYTFSRSVGVSREPKVVQKKRQAICFSAAGDLNSTPSSLGPTSVKVPSK